MLHAGGRFQISLNYYQNSSIRNFIAKPSALKLRIVNNNVSVKNFVSKDKLRFSIPQYQPGTIKLVAKGDARGFKTLQQLERGIKPFAGDGSFQFITSDILLSSYSIDLERGFYSVDSNINVFANRTLNASSSYLLDIKNLSITKSSDFSVTLDSSQYLVNSSLSLLINRLITLDRGIITLGSNIPLFVNRTITAESNQISLNHNTNLILSRLLLLNNTFISLNINPDILVNRLISADRGQSIITSSVDLLANRLLLANKESLLIGFNPSVSITRFISADSNQSLVGSNVNLFTNRLLFVDSSFTDLNFNPSISIGRFISAGSYQAEVSSNVNVSANRLITIDKGVYNLQIGIDSVTLSRVIEAANSNYTIEGKEAQLFLNRYLNAQVGYIFVTSSIDLTSTIPTESTIILYFDLSINKETSFVLRR